MPYAVAVVSNGVPPCDAPISAFEQLPQKLIDAHGELQARSSTFFVPDPFDPNRVVIPAEVDIDSADVKCEIEMRRRLAGMIQGICMCLASEGRRLGHAPVKIEKLAAHPAQKLSPAELQSVMAEARAIVQAVVTDRIGRQHVPTMTPPRSLNSQGDASNPTDGTSAPPVADALSEKMKNVLIAMFELHAFDSDSRRATDAIARKADGPSADPESFKTAIAGLKSRGYVDTKEGRGGGCWLTDSGKSRADKLAKL